MARSASFAPSPIDFEMKIYYLRDWLAWEECAEGSFSEFGAELKKSTTSQNRNALDVRNVFFLDGLHRLSRSACCLRLSNRPCDGWLPRHDFRPVIYFKLEMLDHKVVLAMAIKSEWCAASEFNLNLAHAALAGPKIELPPPGREERKWFRRTRARFEGTVDQPFIHRPKTHFILSLFALYLAPLNDREIQNLILRIRPYLPRVQWTWQRTGAAFCNRFRGYYFDGGIQDQIRSAIANFDAGGDRLITSIDALGSRMAGQAIRQLEGQWRLMNDVGRH